MTEYASCRARQESDAKTDRQTFDNTTTDSPTRSSDEEVGEFNRTDLSSHVLKDRLTGPSRPGETLPASLLEHNFAGAVDKCSRGSSHRQTKHR